MEYKLIRSKRKTLAVCVTGGEVIVKAPIKMPIEHIEKFLSEKSFWIAKKAVEQNKKNAEFSDVIGCSAALYHGAKIPIVKSETLKRTSFDGNAVYLPKKLDGKEQNAVKTVFKKQAEKELSVLLREASARVGLNFGSFALTNARGKWGSCDEKNNIMLNWRIIMLDAELAEYVIIHELSHTVHHDHSKAFWAQVEKSMPRYKAAKKRLKTYSFLTTLYR